MKGMNYEALKVHKGRCWLVQKLTLKKSGSWEGSSLAAVRSFASDFLYCSMWSSTVWGLFSSQLFHGIIFSDRFPEAPSMVTPVIIASPLGFRLLFWKIHITLLKRFNRVKIKALMRFTTQDNMLTSQISRTVTTDVHVNKRHSASTIIISLPCADLF